MEIFDDRVCALGEGPAYDDRTGRAYWVDVPGHRVLWRDVADGSRGELPVGSDVSAVIPRENGGLIGDDANRAAIEPRESNDDVLRVVPVDLEEISFVGHRMNQIEHVVGLVR